MRRFDPSDRPGLPGISSGLVPLHSGNPEQPQNCAPARPPWRAVRRAMGFAQRGQLGACAG